MEVLLLEFKLQGTAHILDMHHVSARSHDILVQSDLMYRVSIHRARCLARTHKYPTAREPLQQRCCNNYKCCTLIIIIIICTFASICTVSHTHTTQSKLRGPGTYSIETGAFTVRAMEEKLKGPNWERARDVAKMAAMPHMLYKNQWEHKRELVTVHQY